MKMFTDSTGKPIKAGDTVRFRERLYTIAGFVIGTGRHGTAALEFKEPVHTDEIPDEISVDLVLGKVR